MSSVIGSESLGTPATPTWWSSAASAVDRRLLVVLTLALAVRIGLAWGTAGLDLKIVDEQHYRQLAHSLVRGDGFAWEPANLTSIRPPAYPFFVAGIWTLAGTESTDAVRVAHIGLSLLTVILVFRLGRLMFDRRTAVVAAAIVAFYPSLLFSGVLLLTEVLFTLCLVLTAFGYARLMRAPGPFTAFSTGAALGLAALTRSVLWPFVLVLVPLAMLSVRGGRAQRVRTAALVLLGFMVLVAPWAARNTRLQGTFTIVDTMGGLNLHMGNNAHTPEDRMWDAISLQGTRHWAFEMPATAPGGAAWTEGTKEKWARATALAYMQTNPLTTLRRSVLKFADFWGLERELVAAFQQGLYNPPTWFAVLAVVAVTASYPAVLLLGVMGACVRPPSDRRTHAFVLLVIVCICGLHTIVFGHSRYHLPLIPFISLYAASVATQSVGVWRGWLGNVRQVALPVALAVLFVAIWAREILVRDFERITRFLSAS